MDGAAVGPSGADLAALAVHGPAVLAGAFRDGFRLWLARSGFSAATQSTYFKRVRLYLRWLEHSDLPDALTDASARDLAVSEYLNELMSVAPNDSTHNVSLAAIRAFYESIGLGPVCVDPAMVNPVVPKTLTETEQSVLLDQAAASGPRDYALTVLALDVGPRLSELRRLDIDDVALSTGRAGSARLTAPDDQVREVPLNQATTWVLMGYRAIRSAMLGRHSTEQALFVSKSRRARMSETGIEYVVAAIGRAAGLEISPSILRNTVEQRLLAAGLSLDVVAARMGQNYTNMPRVRALRSAAHGTRSTTRRPVVVASADTQLSFDFT